MEAVKKEAINGNLFDDFYLEWISIIHLNTNKITDKIIVNDWIGDKEGKRPKYGPVKLHWK